ncbi:Mob1/phocein [Delitschia confertaspora ATCC 74209]|uniref:Mob1/phocein n=1 Tax=Delitschia confertaspora ATCC 74209 TaxID=1513339 RepID=A0A9P4MS36_9PLEO|nr:Mob1/phocein [Delitschia confertaspora ATCC 74209]
MTNPVSPSSSPRLPSPPPIAEVQLGPQSPIIAIEDQSKLLASLNHGAARRIRPGTKAADMAEGPPLVDLSEIDSAFQLTEHLKSLHNHLTHPEGTHATVPIDRENALKLAQAPEGVDKTLWLYELCRFLVQKANSIIVALFSDNPPCSVQTCLEMRASEWQYLCAVHEPPKACAAIDYCCHTLDWAANTLTSPKHFPSRLSLDREPTIAHQQIKQLTTIFRRVYRIFAHAWFQHREMFWKVESRTGLYIFFKAVCDVYGLIPDDSYTIPPEAEGIDEEEQEQARQKESVRVNPPFILKREPMEKKPAEKDNEGEGDHILSAANTTKRHRHTPSVGANSVTTVVEENEDDEDQSRGQQEQQTEDPSDSEAETVIELGAEESESTEEEEPHIGDLKIADEKSDDDPKESTENGDTEAATEGEEEPDESSTTAPTDGAVEAEETDSKASGEPTPEEANEDADEEGDEEGVSGAAKENTEKEDADANPNRNMSESASEEKE